MPSRVPPWVVDVAMAAFFVALTLFEELRRVDDGFLAGGTLASLVVLVPFCALLVLRRRTPLLCWTLMHGEYVVAGVFVEHSGFAFATSLPACIATYTVARYADRPWARLGLLSGPLFWIGTLLADGAAAKVVSSIWFDVVTTIVAWGTGRLLGRLSERDEQLQVARDRLVAERALREEAAVREERARIAMEMHDSVAVAVDAVVGRLAQEAQVLAAAGDDVGRLDAALQAGRDALVELRRTMGVLRPEAPQVDRVPTLVDAAELVAGYRDAGLPVSWREERVGDVAQGASFAAYRVLQEALTNALKHGGGPVSATVQYDGDVLVLEVRNRLAQAGSGCRHPSGRHGLVGMRERVEAFGGALRAGVVGEDFEVRAVVPTRTEVPA